jgi:pyridoxal phosphate enzyme (YggS family)
MNLGITHLGENRVHIAREKIDILEVDKPPAYENIHWHMIGNVQRRKTKEVVSLFQIVDAVDRLVLAEGLQRQCDDQNRELDILLEVNISGEDTKHGFSSQALPTALKDLQHLDRLHVKGLMTMAPRGAEESLVRKVFSELRVLAQEHNLPELSMGMSDDFDVAIEEGATQIRLGRILYA